MKTRSQGMKNAKQISKLETLASYMLVPQVMLNSLELDVESREAYHFKLGTMLISIPKESFDSYK